MSAYGRCLLAVVSMCSQCTCNLHFHASELHMSTTVLYICSFQSQNFDCQCNIFFLPFLAWNGFITAFTVAGQTHFSMYFTPIVPQLLHWTKFPSTCQKHHHCVCLVKLSYFKFVGISTVLKSMSSKYIW